jgi:hypothetical protein
LNVDIVTDLDDPIISKCGYLNHFILHEDDVDSADLVKFIFDIYCDYVLQFGTNCDKYVLFNESSKELFIHRFEYFVDALEDNFYSGTKSDHGDQFDDHYFGDRFDNMLDLSPRGEEKEEEEEEEEEEVAYEENQLYDEDKEFHFKAKSRKATSYKPQPISLNKEFNRQLKSKQSATTKVIPER